VVPKTVSVEADVMSDARDDHLDFRFTVKSKSRGIKRYS